MSLLLPLHSVMYGNDDLHETLLRILYGLVWEEVHGGGGDTNPSDVTAPHISH